MKLGDSVKSITNALGIPQCKGCKRRQKRLNKLGDDMAAFFGRSKPKAQAKCEHCGKDCGKRLAVKINGKVKMVGTKCAKNFKAATRSNLSSSYGANMESRVIILSGIPGSGKSTYSKQFLGATICSADQYFMRTGTYKFDPSKLGEAHGSCLKKFIEACQGRGTIIVDNTNTSAMEIAPYFAVAQAYVLPVELVTFNCDPVICAARNTHGVGLGACERMAAAIASRTLPPFWNIKTKNVDCK